MMRARVKRLWLTLKWELESVRGKRMKVMTWRRENRKRKRDFEKRERTAELERVIRKGKTLKRVRTDGERTWNGKKLNLRVGVN